MYTATPECPRCGYDLSGAVAAWSDSCPLEGTCSECGLRLGWARVVTAALHDRPGFFEHARRRPVQSFFATMRRALRPWAFWSWLRMEDRFSWRRLALFVPAAYLISQAFAGLAVGVLALPGVLWLGFNWTPNPWSTPLSIASGQMIEWIIQGAWGLCDLRNENYAHPLPSPLYFFHPVALLAVGVVAAMPLTALLLPTTLRRAKVRPRHIVRVWTYGLVALPLVIELPVAARVVAWTVEGAPWSGAFWPPVDAWIAVNRWHLSLAAVVGWQIVWWSVAAGRYLRLPNPWLIGLLNTVVCSITCLVGFVLIGGASWWLRAW